MKKILVLILAFSFLGLDSATETKKETDTISFKEEIRPTMAQKVQLMQSKLALQNSKVSVGIAELKYEN